jgi:hypothetical protein
MKNLKIFKFLNLQNEEQYSSVAIAISSMLRIRQTNLEIYTINNSKKEIFLTHFGYFLRSFYNEF